MKQAHRGVKAVARRVALDKGCIVEIGDGRSLLAQGGLYARLWAHQSGGFLVDDDYGDNAPDAFVAEGEPVPDKAMPVPPVFR